MPAITFYKHEPIPMEMHKVKIVQQLHLAACGPVAWRECKQAGFNTFQLHNGDIFLDMLTDSGVNAMSDLQQSAMLRPTMPMLAPRHFSGCAQSWRSCSACPSACPPIRAAPARIFWPPVL